MTDDLLDLLRCPLTRQRLRVASAEVLTRCVPAVTEALVREDGAMVYPIVQRIPQLRPGDAVAVTSNLGGTPSVVSHASLPRGDVKTI